MPTPSLLIVPARFKTGKLYSQIPVPVAPSTSSVGDFNVTRNTAARRFGPDGLIESVASGIPRLDYYTSGGVTGCPALLVEPAGTNLALQSENFLTTWSTAGTNITVTTGTTAAFTAPDGTTNADLLTASASGNARIVQSFTFVSGTTYTYSAFAKAGSGFFGLTMENTGITSGVAVIWNLNTGAFAVSGTNGAGYTLQSQGIENYGNGWYRCRMTVLLGLGVAGNIRANTSNGTMSSTVIQSASGNTAYIWGAQLETGSVATSYIPTTTGTGSRSADVISVTGAVSGSIGQTEGTMYWEGAIYRYDRVFFALSSGTSTTQAVRLQTTGAGLLQAISISGTVQANPQTSGAVTLGQFNKVAFAYKENDFVLYVNGVLQASDTSGTLPTNLNSVYFCNSNGTEITDQRCRAAALYTTRLTNAELATLTTP